MKIIFFLILTGSLLTMYSCNNGAGKQNDKLTKMKAKLEKLKAEKSKADKDIRDLESEIATLDPALQKERAKLVSAASVTQEDFTHYIELQGKVDANDIVVVTPRGMPAQVRELYVKRGDLVTKGQLLIKLDDAIMLQQMDGLKTQLSYAKNIYNRQKNLWDQGIGTEVQLITAKNNVDALDKQIATLNENWKTSFVYSPINGLADIVNIKTGEIFSGASSMGPQIQIVNSGSMKIVTEIPENYQTRVNKGTQLIISIPDAGIDSINSVINVMGASIHNNSRSFITEAKIPSITGLKINQVALVKIKDYHAPNAITIPINVVQTDEKGKFVYVIMKEGNVMKARKKQIMIGESFNGKTEIKGNTLATTDLIITEGYQSVYDGQIVRTDGN